MKAELRCTVCSQLNLSIIQIISMRVVDVTTVKVFDIPFVVGCARSIRDPFIGRHLMLGFFRISAYKVINGRKYNLEVKVEFVPVQIAKDIKKIMLVRRSTSVFVNL